MDQHLSARPTRITRQKSKKLCKRCRKINLDAILQMKCLTKSGNPVRKFSAATKWDIESCSLCKLLFQAAGQSKRPDDALELRRLSTRKVNDRGWGAIDITTLKIGSCFLVPQPRDSHIVRTLGRHLDTDVVKHWLATCTQWHNGLCNDLEPVAVTSSISSFKLIDCNTRQVVLGKDAEQQPYVTLSYVWGQNTEAPSFSYLLPQSLPQTIEDAIEVTKQLGYRFLWIDRFCINQTDQSEKAEQCPKMDLIYGNSQLTIIAAAGNGPHHGLPGVSPRSPNQPSAQVAEYFLISAMEDPTTSIMQSEWNTRGWTYQEGILSRRRLIFTEEQVYFECRSMYCCEALNLPLDGLHTQNHQRFQARYCNGGNIGIFPRSFGNTTWEVLQRIKEFSARKLSRREDVLNALMGILQALKVKPNNITGHVLGIPLLPTPPKIHYRDPGYSSDEELDVPPRDWSSLKGFCAALCWELDTPSSRRQGFPTWSWTGWTGSVDWGHDMREGRNMQADPNIQVKLELTNGNLFTWSEFEKSYEYASARLSGTLLISAWLFPLQNIRVGRRSYPRQWTVDAEVDGDDGRRFKWSFNSTSMSRRVLDPDVLGVQIAHGHWNPYPETYVLVVSRRDSGPYQRIGLGKLSFNHLKDMEAMKSGHWQPAWTFNKHTPGILKEFREIAIA